MQRETIIIIMQRETTFYLTPTTIFLGKTDIIGNLLPIFPKFIRPSISRFIMYAVNSACVD